MANQPVVSILTAQQQMILDAFQSEVYVSNRMDVQHTPLYDRVGYAAGATINQLSSAFFTNVGPASGKTLAWTNMTQSQRLQAPEAFSIFGFRLRIAETILRLDLDIILDQFALEFYLGQKPYQRAPLWYFQCGAGIAGFSMLAGDACYTNGVPDRNAMHKLASTIVIENQMTFYAQFVGTPYVLAAGGVGGLGAVFVLLLDGLYARGVQ